MKRVREKNTLRNVRTSIIFYVGNRLYTCDTMNGACKYPIVICGHETSNCTSLSVDSGMAKYLRIFFYVRLYVGTPKCKNHSLENRLNSHC